MGLIEFLLGDDVVDALSGGRSDEEAPTCNHCGSTNLTPNGGKNVQKYHCNFCFTGTSDTAGTVWHKTHLPPEKRAAIEQGHKEGKSRRQVAQETGVSRNSVGAAYDRLDGIPPKSERKKINRFALFGFDDE